ncbi:hypothetical protein SFRURICE_019131 [Spodoptera frugiperda]|nr:hypothetical protein SFRURICE_019131 [Spodoptera frugiperda]
MIPKVCSAPPHSTPLTIFHRSSPPLSAQLRVSGNTDHFHRSSPLFSAPLRVNGNAALCLC